MDIKEAWSVLKTKRLIANHTRPITADQLSALNATLSEVLTDKALRKDVIRIMLQLDVLESTKDLTFADAHGILSAAYPDDLTPGVDKPDEGFVQLVRRAERAALKEAGE